MARATGYACDDAYEGSCVFLRLRSVVGVVSVKLASTKKSVSKARFFFDECAV